LESARLGFGHFKMLVKGLLQLLGSCRIDHLWQSLDDLLLGIVEIIELFYVEFLQ